MTDSKAHPILVTVADLPLCCPPKNQSVWNQHPRVYLPISDAGAVVCPYCNATYILKEEPTK